MARGKYADITPNLPRLSEEADYQDKINAFKAAFVAEWEELHNGAPPSSAALAFAYAELRTSKDELEERLKQIQLHLTAVEQLTAEAYEADDLSNCRLENGTSVSIQYEPHATVVNRAEVRQWAIENGLEDALSLNWQTLNAITKERLLHGEAPPNGASVWSRPKFVLRRS